MTEIQLKQVSYFTILQTELPIQIKPSKQALVPQNLACFLWSTLNFLTISYFILYIPFYITFSASYSQIVQEIFTIVRLIFVTVQILYIVSSFFIGYYQQGMLILDLQKVSKNYANWPLAIDLIGIVVLILPIYLPPDWSYLQLIYLIKFYNIGDYARNLRRVLFRRQNSGRLYLVLQLSFIVLVFTHYLSCGCYLLSNRILQLQVYGDQTPQVVWIINNQAWQNIPELALGWQYTYALYFGVSVITTIAFGDISPMNPYQTVYVMFMYLCAVIWFAYIIEQFISILSQTYIKRYQFNRQVKQIDRFMQKRQIDHNIRNSVLAHYQYLWNTKRYYRCQQQKIINELTPFLRQSLLKAVNSKYYSQLALFDNIPLRAIQQISNEIVELHVLPHHVLPIPPMGQSCLLFCQDLRYQVIYTFPQNKLRVSKLQCKAGILGQYQFFTGQQSQYSYQSLRSTMILKLSRSKVQQILRKNNCYHLFLRERDKLLAKMYEHSNLRCICCQSYRHTIYQCPSVFVKLNNKRYKHQPRKKFKRSTHKSNTVQLKQAPFSSIKVSQICLQNKQQQTYLNDTLQRAQNFLKQLQLTGSIIANQQEKQSVYIQSIFQLPGFYQQANIAHIDFI